MSLYTIPFLAALTGWLANKITISLLLNSISRYKQQLAEKIADFVAAELFSFKEIRHRLTDPEKIKAIIPVVEEHMDTFLRVKLPEAMPVFKMFIGDSTIQQVKAVLVKELDRMFPELIGQYLSNMEKEMDVRELVRNKIAAIPTENIKSQIRQSLRRELRMVEGGGAVLGLLIGLLQLMIALHHSN